MADTYVELLVKRKSSPMGKALRFACIFMGVMQIMLYILSKGWFFVGSALLFFALSYFSAFIFRVEYEYLLLGSQLSVDKILNQRKRKKVAEYELSTDLEILAPIASPHLDRYRQMIRATKDFSSQSKDCETYGMVIHVEKELELIKIEYNEELMNQIALVCRRKVFKD